MAHKKKLIEVALPLEAINKASAREKSIRHGHPSTLHLWWARRPLAAARAVLFAQMVDDPSSYPDLFPTEKAQDKERQRLFRIIEDLVQWENTNNEEVLQAARDEIWRSWRRTCAENADHPQAKELFNRHKLPAFHDPFAGGGSIPLEAQRLGLESHASDLNPVAVLINKAMIEIPPKFAGKPPVNPKSRADKKLIERAWRGAEGLAEDVRYYGQWMRDEAEKRIGHLYPKVEITNEMARERPDLKPLIGQRLTVIAWLWARTVKSPNPAFADVDVPLISTFLLATKPGKEAYLEPVVESCGYRFSVHVGKPANLETARGGTKLGRGANFRCVMSGTPIEGDYIKREGKAGRMGVRMMALVAEGVRGRVYLSPTMEHEAAARAAEPEWRPDLEFFQQALGFRVGNYGMSRWGDLFTDRQTVALTTFADLVQNVRGKVRADIEELKESNAAKEFPDPETYADAIGVYLSFAVDRSADFWSNLCVWANQPKNEVVSHLFTKQTVPMAWDFAEASPLSNSGGSFSNAFSYVAKGVAFLPSNLAGNAIQLDAGSLGEGQSGRVVSTDPPYYDNVGYADLSDFFYVWLRRSLRAVYPDLFTTVAVPKATELVATPERHGGRAAAEEFFLEGMTRAVSRLAEQAHPAFPVTIYYAFKQAEGDANGTASTGWDTFLQAVIRSGFDITGTWPVRTEREARSRGLDSNALASSIVLVCRPRLPGTPTATRREFLAALKAEVPEALKLLQHGNVAPVDLAQSSIGPGMAVYTRYSTVLDASGKPLSVREALALINQTLDEILTEQEGDFDPDTRWALAWFDQQGFSEGDFGTAETLSKAKNTSISGLVEAGILQSHRGNVRLLKPGELLADWDPATDKRLTVWEMVHHLIRVLEAGGETAAADLAGKLGSQAEIARELAYRLYSLCERKKRAAEALSYNALVQSWPEITRLARDKRAVDSPEQTELFVGSEG